MGVALGSTGEMRVLGACRVEESRKNPHKIAAANYAYAA